MIIYANIHSALEQRRIQAAPTGAMGPRVCHSFLYLCERGCGCRSGRGFFFFKFSRVGREREGARQKDF